MTPDEQTEPVLCPGCKTEMTDTGITGNYRVYKCPDDCSITLEQALTGDHGGMSVEDLQQMGNYHD